jgi:hypothetical protein
MRTLAKQNLQVAAVNAALQQKLITLEYKPPPAEAFFRNCEPAADPVFDFTVAGYPALGSLHDVGAGEVSFHAYACPTELARRTARAGNDPLHLWHGWRRFGGAMTTFYFGRRRGKHLLAGDDFGGDPEIIAALAAARIKPLGFGTKPTKHGYDFHKEYEQTFGPCRR